MIINIKNYQNYLNPTFNKLILTDNYKIYQNYEI